jgi:isocitrate lyase
MSKSIVNTNPYPFHFEANQYPAIKTMGKGVTINFDNCRGATPSIKASRVRALIQEAHSDPSKIVANVCSYDALSSRLCEEAGFPIVFLAGYPMASAFGLPDTGYIAFGEVVNKVQEVIREVNVPVIVDGDTGYGSPMNVRRTVQGYVTSNSKRNRVKLSV